MKTPLLHSFLAALVSCAVAAAAGAQDAQQSAFLNPKLSPEKRAEDIVHRMTLEEKASQLVHQSRAIPRLGIPQ